MSGDGFDDLRKFAWEVVKSNRPKVNLSADYVNAVPRDVPWEQLSAPADTIEAHVPPRGSWCRRSRHRRRRRRAGRLRGSVGGGRGDGGIAALRSEELVDCVRGGQTRDTCGGRPRPTLCGAERGAAPSPSGILSGPKALGGHVVGMGLQGSASAGDTSAAPTAPNHHRCAQVGGAAYWSRSTGHWRGRPRRRPGRRPRWPACQARAAPPGAGPGAVRRTPRRARRGFAAVPPPAVLQSCPSRPRGGHEVA